MESDAGVSALDELTAKLTDLGFDAPEGLSLEDALAAAPVVALLTAVASEVRGGGSGLWVVLSLREGVVGAPL